MQFGSSAKRRGGWGLTFALIMLVVMGGIWLGLQQIQNLASSKPKRADDDSVLSDNDPRIQAARAEARHRLPEFLGLWRARQPGQRFFVSAKFSDYHLSEFLWVFVDSIDGNKISGTVDVEPQRLRNLQMGSHVTLKMSEVDDWLYEAEHDRRGEFIEKVWDEVKAKHAAKRAATRPATAPATTSTAPVTSN